MIKMMLVAGAGGFVGTCCRFLVNRFMSEICSISFPMATFSVNLIGCFLFGLFLGLFERTHMLASFYSTLLMVGFCGGFTTFSSFAAELTRMCNKTMFLPFMLYLGASVFLGIILVMAGRWITN